MTEAVMDVPAPPGPVASRGWANLMGSLVSGVLFGTMLGLAVLGIVATQFLGFRLLAVSSGSMFPALDAGDVIVVKPAAIGSIEMGDIVLFEGGGDAVLTVHRVVGLNEVITNVTSRATGEVTTLTDYRLITQGDANPAPDAGEVKAAQLRGQVWLSIPNPLAGLGVPFQALLFLVAGVTGLAWLAWEFVVRTGATRMEGER